MNNRSRLKILSFIIRCIQAGAAILLAILSASFICSDEWFSGVLILCCSGILMAVADPDEIGRYQRIFERSVRINRHKK